MKFFIWRKKKYIKIQILLITMMICVGLLSGCNETSVSLTDEEKRFVGTWNGNTTIFNVIAFFPDRACSYLFDLSAIWKIKDEKLVIKAKQGEFTYDYSFSNNNDTLIITYIESGESWIYRRQ